MNRERPISLSAVAMTGGTVPRENPLVMPRFNICRACWLKLRPRTSRLLVHHRQRHLQLLRQPNFDSIYVREHLNQKQSQEITKEKTR